MSFKTEHLKQYNSIPEAMRRRPKPEKIRREEKDEMRRVGCADRLRKESQSLEILVTLPVKSDWNKSLKGKSYFPACYRGDAA